MNTPILNSTPTSFPWKKELLARWKEAYADGSQPDFYVKAPGRVNLIGEHVDHQAYPVCPSAIQQTLGLAVKFSPIESGKPVLELAHVHRGSYPSKQYKSVEEIKVEDTKVWYNYVAAAYFGVVEYCINGLKSADVGRLIDPKKGLMPDQIKKAKDVPAAPNNYRVRIVLTGDVPAAAGLSSSAAVVVGMTIAFASKLPLDRVSMADLCAKAERYTGVASGGMDQAAILLSHEGAATLIHFKPLTADTIKLPKGGSLIITNTCVEAPKAKMAAKMYNKRVFELKAGCLGLLPPEVAAKITADELLDLQLRDVVRDYLRSGEREILASLESRLQKKTWSRDDMLKIFGAERRDVLLKKRCGENVWTDNEDFDVFLRVRHVLSEALRVEDFAEVAGSSALSDEEKLERLGALMNASGQSMATDFDATCPEIDEVVNIARAAGAYGSRVTGAGWGGCAVSLVPTSAVDTIISALKKEYFAPIYAKKRPAPSMLPPEELLDTCVFATAPSSAAEMLL